MAGVWRATDFAGISRSDVQIVHSEYSTDGGGRAFSELMASKHSPTAIWATGASLALGAAIAAGRLGVSIPGTVSLIGLGNPPWVNLMRPSLTTYTLPLQELAMTAALLMNSRIESRETTPMEPVQVILSGRVNVRESTGEVPH
jgi:LacI family transcriptional regulator